MEPDAYPPGLDTLGALVCAALLVAACATPAPESDPDPADREACEVLITNQTNYPLRVEYVSGRSVPIGTLDPDQQSGFAVPCDQGRISIRAYAPSGADLDRGRNWTRVWAELVPGEVVRVGLREGGGGR